MINRIIAIICCIPLALSIPIDPLIHKFESEIKQKKLEVPKIENSLDKVLKAKYERERLERLEFEKLWLEHKMKLFEIEHRKLQEREDEEQEIKKQNTYENKTRNTINNLSGREATFNITFYDACYSCTQNTSNPGLTASGKMAQQGITVAAPKNLPFGTKIQIGNNTFEVMDRGSAIVNFNGMIHIDVYVNTHEQALRLGRKIVKGRILS